MSQWPPIDLASFSWEALATLVTGLGAVIAAGVIGWRQTEILKRQVEVEALARRIELFDRRLETYRVVRSFVIDAARGEDLLERYISTLQAIEDCRYLFSPEVAEVLKEVIPLYNQGREVSHRMLMSRGRAVIGPIDPPEYQEPFKRLKALIPHLEAAAAPDLSLGVSPNGAEAN